mmetsp:Transcript_3598/g.9252  ORF Transcript_3598/g.9252 Transcript_3598/m.9252 type:complete len:212 (+) Transcript_3598:21-656(+)
MDQGSPSKVWFAVGVGSEDVGRIDVELNDSLAPRSCRNFRRLCEEGRRSPSTTIRRRKIPKMSSRGTTGRAWSRLPARASSSRSGRRLISTAGGPSSDGSSRAWRFCDISRPSRPTLEERPSPASTFGPAASSPTGGGGRATAKENAGRRKPTVPTREKGAPHGLLRTRDDYLSARKSGPTLSVSSRQQHHPRMPMCHREWSLREVMWSIS